MIKQTRTTNKVVQNENSKNFGKIKADIEFQQEVLGTVESLVTNGTVEYWADFADTETNTLYDAKFATNDFFKKASQYTVKTEKSPFRQEAFAPVQAKIEASIVEEFSRVKEIINTTNFTKFVVVTNDENTIPFFKGVAEKVGFEFEIEVK